MQPKSQICPLRWQDHALYLLDQRRLPATETWLRLDSAPEVAEAIRNMVVRGAPAIGFAAAFGVVLSFQQHGSAAGWRNRVESDIEMLAAARPTAVNLAWSLGRMAKLLSAESGKLAASLLDEAQDQLVTDREQNLQLGQSGAALIEKGSKVMTHCNAGALATAGYGTALAVVRVGHWQQKIEQVFVGETRPWFQGSRLTAWELAKDGIPVTVLADSAAAQAMREAGINWLIVGADRIAANGDVANKIGTYALAVVARYHGAKVMVVAPHATVDMSVSDGSGIPIEERSADEILAAAGIESCLPEITVANPAFDITPAALIDFIVTEKGVFQAPFDKAFKGLKTGKTA
ncbi:MAG: S-methyl-5-thioribose-1-phosphate isomerase [Gammaproteobacteria bacterium]